jgi:hypothetical protein
MVETTTAVYLTYTSGVVPWGFPLVTTTSWTQVDQDGRPVPLNEIKFSMGCRSDGRREDILPWPKVDFDLRHDVFPPNRRSDNAAHGGY